MPESQILQEAIPPPYFDSLSSYEELPEEFANGESIGEERGMEKGKTIGIAKGIVLEKIAIVPGMLAKGPR